MKTKPIPRIELGLLALLAAVGLGAFALSQAPQMFGEAAPGTPEYAARRQRIEQMTQADRDRIRRRHEKFNELSETRRDAVRKLHADLQTAPDAPELQTVLKRYNDWLTSLSVAERHDLREKLKEAKTPAEQWQIIARKKLEKDDERLLQSAPKSERSDYYRERDPKKRAEILSRIRETYAYGAQRSWGPTLKVDELDSVINVIAGQLKPSAAQLAKWGKLKPQQRRLKIMIAALKEHSQRRRKREFGKPEPGLLSDSDLRQPIENEIKDRDLRERLLQKPGFRRRSNYRILFLVKNTIDQERRQECGNPTVEQLSRFFEGLSEQRMEDLAQQGPEKMKTLKRWYFFSGGENGEDYRTFVTESFAAFRPPRPPFGFRSKRSGGPPMKGDRGSRPRGGQRSPKEPM